MRHEGQSCYVHPAGFEPAVAVSRIGLRVRSHRPTRRQVHGRCVPSARGATSRSLRVRDLNPRRQTPSDLQSGPFGRTRATRKGDDDGLLPSDPGPSSSHHNIEAPSRVTAVPALRKRPARPRSGGVITDGAGDAYAPLMPTQAWRTCISSQWPTPLARSSSLAYPDERGGRGRGAWLALIPSC